MMNFLDCRTPAHDIQHDGVVMVTITPEVLFLPNDATMKECYATWILAKACIDSVHRYAPPTRLHIQQGRYEKLLVALIGCLVGWIVATLV